MILLACDNPDVRKTSELEGFRILGLRSSPHIIELNANVERLDVEVIAFAADDIIGYEWTLCASLGALARFECIPDTPTLTGQSSSSTWTIPFSQAALASLGGMTTETMNGGWVAPICPDYELIGCVESQQCPIGALCLEGACRSPTEVYPVSLIVRVEPIAANGNEISGALTLPIRAGRSNNTSITAMSLKIGALQSDASRSDTCANLTLPTRPAQPVTVSLVFEEESIDTFTRAADGVCVEQSELTTGSISWFATGAALQRPISDLDDPSNELELESDSEAFTVYGVIRDGRGSLDYICAHVQIE